MICRARVDVHVNMIRSRNVVFLPGQYRRRRANNKPALGQRIVFEERIHVSLCRFTYALFYITI